DGHVEASLGPADLLDREGRTRAVEDALEERVARALLADERVARDVHLAEGEGGLPARHVDGGEVGLREAVGLTGDEEERDALGALRALRARRDHDAIGGEAVEDVALLTGEDVVVAALLVLALDLGRVPPRARLGVREGEGGLATRDVREELALLCVVAAEEERVHPEADRREDGAAVEEAPHLLEDRHEIDRAEAETFVLLGDRHREPAELFGDALVDRGIEAALGFHRRAHTLARRLDLEEATGRAAQLELFFVESKVHDYLFAVAALKKAGRSPPPSMTRLAPLT